MRFRFPVILYLEFADFTSPWTLNSESRVKHLVHRITDQDPGICRYYCAYRSLTVVAAQHLDTASIPVPPNSYWRQLLIVSLDSYVFVNFVPGYDQ